ncbi:uncharacterized protein BDV17DRAFT_260495 [Aspergillus undulatus]|uniref:uncharacterized protein n=1 Tax=Aspergillus undulatus TaxID=1810928 RepID=UPI003CCCD7DE
MASACASLTSLVPLSGDILRLHRNLPSLAGHVEIDGDDIRPLSRCMEWPEAEEDDSECVSDLVFKLPLVDVDPAKRFTKKRQIPKRNQESHCFPGRVYTRQSDFFSCYPASWEAC